jgi:hypothetical protein
VKPEASPLERFCSLFGENGVEFMVIGGQAEALMGSPRVTYDYDFCYRRTPSNLASLARALGTLKLALRGAPADLRFRVDAESLALGSNFTFTVDGEYPLDLLGFVEPIGTYEDLLPGAQTMQIAGKQALVIGLEDLIKEHIGRPKDRESLLQLRAIERLRREAAGP